MTIICSRNIILIILQLLWLGSFATILEVKKDGTGDYLSIQEAYNNCVDNDSILVFPGVWEENLEFSSYKRVYLTSNFLFSQNEADITNTIIDGGGTSSCIYISEASFPGSVINGFTIQNGNGYSENRRGGGICLLSSCSVLNCMIKDNTAMWGGGIYINGATIHVSNSKIINNWAIRSGGGFYIRESTVSMDTVNKSDIYLNHASKGTDIWHNNNCNIEHFVIDTFTVLHPDHYYYLTQDASGNPLPGCPISVSAPKIQTLNADLYVNPISGNNNNSGLSEDEPLKTIDWAFKKIASDSIDPKTIYLANGLYSWSSNKERLPVSGRNYVSVIGEDREDVILDAEDIGFVFRSSTGVHGYKVKNVTFINGNGYYEPWGMPTGVEVYFGYDVVFDSIIISNCSGPISTGFMAGRGSNFTLSNSIIENNVGNRAVIIAGMTDQGSTFRIENVIVNNNNPDPNSTIDYRGGGIGLFGPSPGNDFYLSGQIINTHIANNVLMPDPDWGPGAAAGLSISENVKVDLINSTISLNEVVGIPGYAVNVQERSEINIYNSILYNNEPAELAAGHATTYFTPSIINVDYSNIQGGEENIKNWYDQNIVIWHDHNMDESPVWESTGATAFHLLPGSPCINSGVPLYNDTLELPYFKMEEEKLILYKIDGDTVHMPKYDLAGQQRIVDGRIDMGAYEFQDTIVRISTSREYFNILLSISPNPTNTGFIKLKYSKTGYYDNIRLKVFNVHGEEVHYKRILKHQGESLIDVGQWPGGMYLVIVYSDGKPVGRAKFVVR